MFEIKALTWKEIPSTRGPPVVPIYRNFNPAKSDCMRCLEGTGRQRETLP